MGDSFEELVEELVREVREEGYWWAASVPSKEADYAKGAAEAKAAVLQAHADLRAERDVMRGLLRRALPLAEYAMDYPSVEEDYYKWDAAARAALAGDATVAKSETVCAIAGDGETGGGEG